MSHDSSFMTYWAYALQIREVGVVASVCRSTLIGTLQIDAHQEKNRSSNTMWCANVKACHYLKIVLGSLKYPLAITHLMRCLLYLYVQMDAAVLGDRLPKGTQSLSSAQAASWH